MTETELRAFPPFDKLPCVHENDMAACEKLEKPDDPSIYESALREASDLEELKAYCANPKYVPKGAIIYGEGAAHAFFWIRQRVVQDFSTDT